MLISARPDVPLPYAQRAAIKRYQLERAGQREPMPDILGMMSSPAWCGDAFAPAESWLAWRAFLSACFGLPLCPGDEAIYQQCTGRTTAPTAPVREAWLACGRRAGKSRISALAAVYLATTRDYSAILAPGETATIPIIAAARPAAQTVMGYVKGLLQLPGLRRFVVRDLAESIELTNRVQIEVHTASFRAVRSYTVVSAICDEIAFWDTGEASANPDIEILRALRPGMLTVPDALLLCLSSPYERRGALWEAYRDHYGQDDPRVLVWKAQTREMNQAPSKALDEEIEQAYRNDPDAAAAEYGGEFRRDVERYVSEEVIRDVVRPGCEELPPADGVSYVAFVDPSGGSQDSMTLAIAHLDGQCAVLDCLREVRPPFVPSAVVAGFVTDLRRYRCQQVTGDRYAGEWPREHFRQHGVEYRLSERTKSEIYLDFLPRMNNRAVALLDNIRLTQQLRSLERRTARGGRDSVDHPPRGHDDTANAAAGALVLVSIPGPSTHVSRLMV